MYNSNMKYFLVSLLGFIMVASVGFLYLIHPTSVNTRRSYDELTPASPAPISSSSGNTGQGGNVTEALPSAEQAASSTELPAPIELDASWGPAPTQNDGSSLYWIQNGQVYYDQSYVGPTVIAGADATTFEVSQNHEGFGRDKNHVYWGDVIPGADPSTFEILYPPDGQWTCYAKDKGTVWFFCGIGSPYPVVGADALSFRVVDDPVNPGSNQCQEDIAYDKSRYYCEGGADQ